MIAHGARYEDRSPFLELLEPRLLLSGQIAGSVWCDFDADGVRDPSEPGLDDWLVQLIDPASHEAVATTATVGRDSDGDGSIDPLADAGLYRFLDVPAGEWMVRLKLPPGWQPTTGPEISVVVEAGQTAAVNLGVHHELPGDLNFDGVVGMGDLGAVLDHFGKSVPLGTAADLSGDGFVGQADLDAVLARWAATPPAGVISGQKFNDTNANGLRDTDEPGLDGWLVELIDPATYEVIATAETAGFDLNWDGAIDPLTEAGLYFFPGLADGAYELRVEARPGWENTTQRERLFVLQIQSCPYYGPWDEPGYPDSCEPGVVITEQDPATDAIINVMRRSRSSWPLNDIAYGPGRLFDVTSSRQADGAGQLIIWEIDPDTGQVLDSDLLGTWEDYAPSTSLAYFEGSVYVYTYRYGGGAELFVWNPETDQVDRTLPLPNVTWANMVGAADLGVIFLTDQTFPEGRRDVVALDPETAQPLYVIETDVDPWTIGYANGELIVASEFDCGYRIDRYDPTTGALLSRTGDMICMEEYWHVPDGYAGDGVKDIERVVLSAGEQAAETNFGAFQSAGISGQIFYDADSDGSRGAGERGVNGRWVLLCDGQDREVLATAQAHTEDLNADGLIDPETEMGVFSFDGLAPGEYLICWDDGRISPFMTPLREQAVSLIAGQSADGLMLPFRGYLGRVPPDLLGLAEFADTGLPEDNVTRRNNRDYRNRLAFEVAGTKTGDTIRIYMETDGADVLVGSAVAAETTTVVRCEYGAAHMLEDGLYSFYAVPTTPDGYEYYRSVSDSIQVRIDTHPPTPLGFRLSAQDRNTIGGASLAGVSVVMSEQTYFAPEVSSLTLSNRTTGEWFSFRTTSVSLDHINYWQSVVTWDLTGLGLTEGNYTAVVRGLYIRDLAGNAMDGNLDGWVSYDGDDYVFEFSWLIGDVTGDGFVGLGDIGQVLDQWGSEVPAGLYGDVTGDGFVGQADLDVVLANWGNSLVA